MPAVRDATVVNIAVTRRKLAIFPMRHGDTIAFHTTRGSTPSPERPHQVLWVGSGLTNGMTVKISAKNPVADRRQRLLPQNIYELNQAQTEVLSGLVNLRRPSGDVWQYDVTLWDQNGELLDFEDPDVIIHSDP